MKDLYVPKLGDGVVAMRINNTEKPNTIIGPVVEITDDICVIHTNRGCKNEKKWILKRSEWNINFLV